jgi:hypothetical protein
MKNKIATSVLIAVTISFSLAFTKIIDNRKALENLSGTYKDAKPYSYGKAWGNRIFNFDNGKWSLKFTLALDPEMKMQVFEFRTFGTYKVLEKSDKVTNTYNALFLEDKKFVTLKTSDENLIKAFGFAPCNMTKDVEQDISEKGCSGWKSVSECPGDNDLLSIDKDGKLYFGNRPSDNDMCSPEKRPTSLTPPVLKSK